MQLKYLKKIQVQIMSMSVTFNLSNIKHFYKLKMRILGKLDIMKKKQQQSFHLNHAIIDVQLHTQGLLGIMVMRSSLHV